MSMTLAQDSLAGSMSCLPAEQRAKLLSELSDAEAEAILWDWNTWARPDQLEPPGDWRTWVVKAGRGFGKTRIGAEWTRRKVKTARLVNLIAPTADDARDVMVEGESGLLNICPAHERPIYLPSKRRLEWPNGAMSLIFTADEPDRLRGKQHEALWADEIAAWRYPESWDQAMLGLRLGKNPQAVATTTPRATKFIKDLLADPTTVVTAGSTYANFENLAPAFIQTIIKKYEGSRMGRQELLAEVLDDNPGALWKRSQLDADRVSLYPDLARIVVAVDPSGGDGPENDEQGIICAGKGIDGRGYVLADRTCKLDPDGWGRRVVKCYIDHNADCVVVEKNFGGAMATHVIRTAAQAMGIPVMHIKEVTASRGKVVRADPVSALDAQHRISHVGSFPELEDELCDWEPDSGVSPNRLDARVWAITELMLGPSRKPEFL
jgi:phage terminase large subunit-like protein